MRDEHPHDFTEKLRDSLGPGRRIHMSGIAGSAMRGLAKILAVRGCLVRGTDPGAEQVRKQLRAFGVEVEVAQDGRSIARGTDLVIKSAALGEDHPEIVRARALGIPVANYAEALGALTADMTTVAVAGTHGKTSTSAMIASVLDGAGRRPGYLIGGTVPGLGGSADLGGEELFVVEACEYNRSFLSLRPHAAVLNNIEPDHLDCYPSIDSLLEAFGDFVSRIVPAGVLVYNADCPRARDVAAQAPCRTVSFSLQEFAKADLAAAKLRLDGGRPSFALGPGSNGPIVSLTQPGRHSVANALAAASVCRALGLTDTEIAEGLSAFGGVKRRFEVVVDEGDLTVIDDYAHHPSELKALIAAARTRFPTRRLVAVFQPHQSFRTLCFLDDFAEALTAADVAWVCDIYSARDSAESQRAVHARDLVEAARRKGADGRYAGALGDAVSKISLDARRRDVILLAGAGDVGGIAQSLAKAIRGQ